MATFSQTEQQCASISLIYLLVTGHPPIDQNKLQLAGASKRRRTNLEWDNGGAGGIRTLLPTNWFSYSIMSAVRQIFGMSPSPCRVARHLLSVQYPRLWILRRRLLLSLWRHCGRRRLGPTVSRRTGQTRRGAKHRKPNDRNSKFVAHLSSSGSSYRSDHTTIFPK
jgi:hypothetical protein